VRTRSPLACAVGQPLSKVWVVADHAIEIFQACRAANGLRPGPEKSWLLVPGAGGPGAPPRPGNPATVTPMRCPASDSAVSVEAAVFGQHPNPPMADPVRV